MPNNPFDTMVANVKAAETQKQARRNEIGRWANSLANAWSFEIRNVLHNAIPQLHSVGFNVHEVFTQQTNDLTCKVIVKAHQRSNWKDDTRHPELNFSISPSGEVLIAAQGLESFDSIRIEDEDWKPKLRIALATYVERCLVKLIDKA